jgi:hypothetical protein
MSDSFHSLAKEHHAFYEVLPYYVLLEARHGSSPVVTRRVQAGFDVEIYGVNIKDELVVPGPDPHYALGYARLQKIVETVSHRVDHSCSLEVIPFHSTFVLDSRNQTVEAMIRVRISHWRGLDQPAGPAEQHALEEVENRLRDLGVARR